MKIDPQEIFCEDMNWTDATHNRYQLEGFDIRTAATSG
jgi:hypothetical protein